MFDMHSNDVLVKWNDFFEPVDVDLAPLVLEICKADIFYVGSSLEADTGLVSIAFHAPECAAQFLNVVAARPAKADLKTIDGQTYMGAIPIKETLYARITERSDDPKAWQFSVEPEDFALDREVIEGKAVSKSHVPADFEFTLIVKFPKTDLPELVELMRRHNQALATPACA
jgi:hypothetical protein